MVTQLPRHPPRQTEQYFGVDPRLRLGKLYLSPVRHTLTDLVVSLVSVIIDSLLALVSLRNCIGSRDAAPYIIHL